MKPAGSIVFFTVSSGAGYGLLFWLGLLRGAGLLPPWPWLTLSALMLALVLITAGLLSSLTHLGHAGRAWRAISQWRSSWLSREGVAALATYAPAVLFGAAVFTDAQGFATLFGLLAAAGAIATVYCTAMIYASLKPIREWHHPLVVPGYLILALFSGATLLAVFETLWHAGTIAATQAAIFGALAAGVKGLYWQSLATTPPVATLETATGLGRIGATRPLDPPHTETNYLLREMGFRVARKHAETLHRVVLWGCGLPALFALLTALGGSGEMLVLTGAIFALGALLVERWLMFAEATHTVMLYYRGNNG